MATYTLQGDRPPILARGLAQTRTINVYQDAGTTPIATLAGTYTLLYDTGAAVSGASAITVTSSVTASFTPLSTITPGWYTERWALTVGGVSRVWLIPALVQTWTLADDELLCSHYHVMRRYPGMVEYAAGATSWQDACAEATARTLTDFGRLVPLTGQAADRAMLTRIAIDAACANIAAQMARNGSAAAAAMMAMHEAAYIDGWSNLRVGLDTDADGVVDTRARPLDQPGFAPAPPLG
jgi:hypothetical protein